MNKRFVRTATAVAVSLLASAAVPALAADAVYVTNQGGGVSVLDPVTLKVERTIDVGGTGPRGVAVTPDGKYLLTANQKTADMSVIDLATDKVVRRVHIGKNPEFLRVTPDGTRAFVTYEPSSKGGPPSKNAKDDDDDKTPGEIAEIDLHSWKLVRSIVGAPETEGIEFSADHKLLAITNEGNDTITVHNVSDGKLVKTVDLSKDGSRPRGIKLSPDGKHYIVTMENSNSFLVLDQDFKVLKSVPTGMGPYGVAFDKTGKHIIVAAARGGVVQVFDGHSHAKLAEVPVGKRCWHFSYTPDESKLLVACGRSDDVEVIDANTYKRVDNLGGFKLPWGIVTYPKAYGSLETLSRP
ncbi:beta-propeller fold lactonase family protein [Nitrogeniibacter mangrovi]|uniref:Beta-propeller fold lactonase family protein n=1 Tax=Nitrogeniibacter mangrovi TaxID=2016596 RepID=A0A6C1B286_9RHOO|nr:beta-propeller fold lactonase family protein [Nitrogeniibacter mangrovi]QID17677.1 beta-propeller fold lactonase family protein [Nitrogeniibacter mangrovi]